MTLRSPRFWLLAFLTLAPTVVTAGEYALVGDAGHWNSFTRKVRDAIQGTGILDLVMPGDNLYEGDSYEVPWSPWRSHGFRFPVVAIGNHHGGYAREIAYFNLPGEYYSVRPEPGVLFIVLNSNHQKIANEQARFLEQELSSSRESLIFVVFHHPLVTLTENHEWTEKEVFHRATTPILLKHRNKITALLLGHDHIAAWFDVGGLPTFVSGATHEALDPGPAPTIQRGLRVKERFIGPAVPQWIKLNTDAPKKTAVFEIVRADTGDMECRVTLSRQGSRTNQQSEHCQNE